MKTEIKTFEDACSKLGIEPNLPIVTMLPEANQKAVIANYQLDIIQQALNGDWKADWSDYKQYKYYPWYEKSSSGVGFSFDDFVYGTSVTAVGSRRVFPDRETAIYFGKQFIDLVNDATYLE